MPGITLTNFRVTNIEWWTTTPALRYGTVKSDYSYYMTQWRYINGGMWTSLHWYYYLDDAIDYVNSLRERNQPAWQKEYRIIDENDHTIWYSEL